MFTRGVPEDYNRWAAEEGCPGWSFADVKPYFLRAEGNTSLADAWHGTDGPHGVSNITSPLPITKSFVMACQQAGIPFNHDFNGAFQAGAGYYQLNVVNGRRCSAARGYLDPARGRANLTILTGAQCKRLIVQGTRVTGVEYLRKGSTEIANADVEVIVTAGAIGSPRHQHPVGRGSEPQAVFLDTRLSTQPVRMPGIAGFVTLHSDGFGRTMRHV